MSVAEDVAGVCVLFFFFKQRTACEFEYGVVGSERCIRDSPKALDAAARLERDLDAATTRITELEAHTAETAALREEREKIRHRVVDMISHIDMLKL